MRKAEREKKIIFQTLEDYGDEPLLFGNEDLGEDDSFPDLVLCGKCAADFRAEENYHSKKLREDEMKIIFEPNTFEDEPKISDMPIRACAVLKALESGMSEREILNKFPGMTPKDFAECLAFAAAQI